MNFFQRPKPNSSFRTNAFVALHAVLVVLALLTPYQNSVPILGNVLGQILSVLCLFAGMLHFESAQDSLHKPANGATRLRLLVLGAYAVIVLMYWLLFLTPLLNSSHTSAVMEGFLAIGFALFIFLNFGLFYVVAWSVRCFGSEPIRTYRGLTGLVGFILVLCYFGIAFEGILKRLNGS